MKFGLSNLVISELCKVFSRHANVEKVLIFGSRAKGCYREGSDIDLAVIGKGLNYSELQRIQMEIDELDMLYTVDLLNYSTVVATPIGEHIDRVGQVFYQAVA